MQQFHLMILSTELCNKTLVVITCLDVENSKNKIVAFKKFKALNEGWLTSNQNSFHKIVDRQKNWHKYLIIFTSLL